jgi:hypothetical protein
MSNWIGLPDNIEEDKHFSIIYLTNNNITGKKYIGKKQLWSNLTKPPLKGYKRKRKITKPSDYLEYYGSSEQLKKDLEQYGKENFTREVLGIATCKWEASFQELLYQLKYNVISSDEYLNGIVNIRLTKMPEKLKSKYKNFKLDFSFGDEMITSIYNEIEI